MAFDSMDEKLSHKLRIRTNAAAYDASLFSGLKRAKLDRQDFRDPSSLLRIVR